MRQKNSLRQTFQLIGSWLKAKKIRSILQTVFSFILLVYIINDVGLHTIIENFSNINLSWYSLAFLLFQLNVIIRAYRWFILLHSLNERATFPHVLYLYFLGFFANNFIPSGFGGDVVKVFTLRQHYGRGAEALSSVVMDRLTGLLGTSIIALVALTLNLSGKTTAVDLPNALWVVIMLISVGIPLSFFFLRLVNIFAFLERLMPAIQRIPRYDSLKNLVATVHRYPLSVLGKSLLISLPFTISLVFIQYAIARAFAVDLPLIIFFLFAPIIAIVNLLPIAFNGLGTRETTYRLLFVLVGVSENIAVSMSLAFYFLRFGAGLIGGLLYVIRNLFHAMRTPSVPPKKIDEYEVEAEHLN